MNTDGQEQNKVAKQEKDWTKPQALAIPKGGFFELEQGKHGPIFPRTPACYGFTIIAKIKPGTESAFREHGNTIEKAIEADSSLLAVLKLHYLRWVLFDIGKETYFMYQGIFDTDFDKYTDDAVAIFKGAGVNTVFENLEGFPEDWKTNAPGLHRICTRTSMPQLPRIWRISLCDRR